jgi:hypothetical protein
LVIPGYIYSAKGQPLTTLCYRKKILIVCQQGINEFQTHRGGLKAVEIIKLS